MDLESGGAYECGGGLRVALGKKRRTENPMKGKINYKKYYATAINDYCSLSVFSCYFENTEYFLKIKN